MKPDFSPRFIAGFSVFLIVVVMLYIAAATFLPITTSGAKYADMAVPLLLGTVIGAITGFFFGSSTTATTPRPPTDPITPQPPKGNP